MDDEEILNPPTRNSMQTVAMEAIYSALTYREMGLDIDVQSIVSGLCDLPYEECDYFVKAALVMALKHLDEAIAAYNAGPANVNKWIKNYGELGTSEEDILTWIETIPFSETRNYVQRVLENLYIYRIIAAQTTSV